jgi:hypothetical protein
VGPVIVPPQISRFGRPGALDPETAGKTPKMLVKDFQPSRIDQADLTLENFDPPREIFTLFS